MGDALLHFTDFQLDQSPPQPVGFRLAF